MKLLLLLVCLAAPAAAYRKRAAGPPKDRRTEFQEAMAKYSKQDGLQSESAELRALRYAAFVKFAADVDRINADPNLPFDAENNFMSILTESERKAHMGFNASLALRSPATETFKAEATVLSAPAKRDFRGGIPPVKDQGNCGSCWTFSASAALEAEIYFTSGVTVSTSEQEMMECSTTRDGCTGGWMEWAYDYSKRSGRLAPESAVPYKEMDNGCSNYGNKANALLNANVKVTGYYKIDNDNDLFSAAASHVISVAVKVSNSFSSYRSGVMTDTTGCASDVNPDHAVAVVGYGTSGSNNYWNVRNSWGDKWGYKGHILMSRDKTDLCRIASFAILPKVECRDSSCEGVSPDEASDGSDGDDGSDGSDGSDDGKPCEDLAQYAADCPGWATSGYCTTGAYTDFMAAYCTKSCGLCGGGASCEDDSAYAANCPAWASYDFCTGRYEEFMEKYCPKSCNKCSTDDDEECGNSTVWCSPCPSDGSAGCCTHIHMCKSL